LIVPPWFMIFTKKALVRSPLLAKYFISDVVKNTKVSFNDLGKLEKIFAVLLFDDSKSQFENATVIVVIMLAKIYFTLKILDRGGRDNIGRKQPNHIDEAVYVGAVGARFERKGKMEYQDIVISQNKNVPG